MSSGPPTNPVGRHVQARRPRGPAGWSLRTRLVLTLVGLVVAVCAIIGVVTTLAVYKFQVGQLDKRLTGAAGRAQDHNRQQLPPDAGMPNIQMPGNSTGTINVHIA